jgi:hypothetical protein
LPGFLDAAGYGGTEKIDLPAGYWIEVRRSLTSPEYEHVQHYLGNGRQPVRIDGPKVVTIDPAGAMREMLFQSVAAWNLDGPPYPDGTIWPLEPDKARRESIAALPNSVLQEVYKACDELNGPREGAEAAQFPEGDVGLPEDGDGPAAGS